MAKETVELTSEQRIAEMEAQLAAEQKLRAETQAQLAATQRQLADARGYNEGWLIRAPNAMYDGATAGIHFTNGMAFIGKGQECPAFKIVPATATSIRDQYRNKMRDGDMTKAEIDEIVRETLERQKTPTAELAAKAMKEEWGYEVVYFDGAHISELPSLMTERANQRRQLEATERAKAAMEATLMPGYMGAK